MEPLLVLLALAAPVALVVIVAMLRGYDMTVIFKRDKERK